ncbi:polyphenol oxidase [Panicum miliaceum]|uniref:Polyphenol oxidase n=1 Tax=Panicum miliaceum TaxID=4540 RepID=A0A3L6PRU8_PANMI|nr:polyphenol oxidase [Panicum miliaceum]
MPPSLQILLGRRAPSTPTTRRNHGRRASPARPRAKATRDRVVDRRDVLLAGLGGAAAAGLTTTRRGTLAAPVQAPDLQSCQTPNVPATATDPGCCMTTYRASTGVID